MIRAAAPRAPTSARDHTCGRTHHRDADNASRGNTRHARPPGGSTPQRSRSQQRYCWGRRKRREQTAVAARQAWEDKGWSSPEIKRISCGAKRTPSRERRNSVSESGEAPVASWTGRMRPADNGKMAGRSTERRYVSIKQTEAPSTSCSVGLKATGPRGAKAQWGDTRPIRSTRRPEAPPPKLRPVRGSMNPP